MAAKTNDPPLSSLLSLLPARHAPVILACAAQRVAHGATVAAMRRWLTVRFVYPILPLLRWLDVRVFRHYWLWLCDYVFEVSIAADLDRMGNQHPLIQMIRADDPDALGELFKANDHDHT